MSKDLKLDNPPATVDPQDPLPETKFTWRRVTTWVVSIWVLVLLSVAIVFLRNMNHADGIVQISMGLIVLLGLLMTYYLIAPSAQHIVDIFARVGAMKSGVVFRSQAQVHSPSIYAQSDSVAGRPRGGLDSMMGQPTGERMAWER